MIPTVDNRKLPEALTPINLKAYFYNAFYLCGCIDIEEVAEIVVYVLKWCDEEKKTIGHNELFSTYIPMPPCGDGFDMFKVCRIDNASGIAYIALSLLDNLGLINHGTSIRQPWLTTDGARLYQRLQQIDSDEINNATGEAYDGITYT